MFYYSLLHSLYKMRKNALILLLAVAFTHIAYAEVLRLSEPVHQDNASETFGALVNELPAVLSLNVVMETPESFIGKPLVLETEVSEVCQKKGCFFIAQQANKTVRVTMKDYGFFVPTDMVGRKVMIIGELIQQEVGDAQALHMSKDLGLKGSVTSGVQYQIVASSIRVPKLAAEQHSDP